MSAWFHQHALALRSGWSRLGRNPLAHLTGILLIAFALGLPAGLYRLTGMVSSLGHDALHEPHLTLFMSPDADSNAVRAVWDSLAALSDVREFRYISSTDALAELKATPGLADAVNALDHNPLPHTFVIRARDGSPAGLESLHATLAGWNKVEQVQVDSVRARQLDALLHFARQATAGLTVILWIAVVFTIFSTVRQQVLASREEIEVIHLIGATAAFIRRPFLYFGLFQGVWGALLACLLLWLGSRWFNQAVQPLGTLFGVDLQLHPALFEEAGWLVAIAATLGWVTAFLSVSLTLRQFRGR